jgi:GT2 family glycosyltransferase
MEYSKAELVGKAPEWVYLSALDLTVKRFPVCAEHAGKVTIAGGAIMMRRSDITAVGGYRRAMSHVDLGLMLDVRRNGWTTYRTHGYGCLLGRNETGHTWDAPATYFVGQSTTRIRGISPEPAMGHE